MMKPKTIRKWIKKANREVDRKLKKKFPDYQTGEELRRKARQSNKKVRF